MDALAEAASLGALIIVSAVVTAWIGRRSLRRTADERRAALAAGVVVAVRCEARWRQGVRRRFFAQGDLGTGPGGIGVAFKSPLRPAVALPVGGRAVVRGSWWPGMRVLEYRAPDGRRIDFHVYPREVGLACRYLGVPDSDWVRPFGDTDGRPRRSARPRRRM
ncbi:hypothetical protein OHA37_30770 [Streptomyces sp. NBC_00335]|uniref:hypothetical protein n=1 Tax=unclassified Streptomyces TaxID=2593676 RepID=UPI0022517516|nr:MULTISPECIES: hypothetical protein [unclassified Streptomyces]MCX5408235.1 hypothetical protein [Streptomyces sp. NBC_00086]